MVSVGERSDLSVYSVLKGGEGRGSFGWRMGKGLGRGIGTFFRELKIPS